jgi:hypothetical protein
MVVGGFFVNGIPSQMHTPSPIYGMDGHELFTGRRSSSVDMPLYHSGPERNAQKLYFSFDELNEVYNQAKIIITFGGKRAPMKACEYTLNFNAVRNGLPAHKIEYENVIMSERQREMNRNEFTSLQAAGVLI